MHLSCNTKKKNCFVSNDEERHSFPLLKTPHEFLSIIFPLIHNPTVFYVKCDDNEGKPSQKKKPRQ